MQLTRDEVGEASKSFFSPGRRERITYRTCGKAAVSNWKHRGLYTCSCDWKVRAVVNGVLNIFEMAYQVSPVKESSGRVARPAAM
jgi:transposase